MAESTLSEMRAKTFQAMQDLSSGKITIEEANNITNQAAEYNKTANRRLSEFKKNLKRKQGTIIDVVVIEPLSQSDTGTIIDAVIIEPLKLSDTDIELAKSIKEKLRKTAETIVEIGESIAKATEKKPKGYKDLFYQTIGISSRSAQRYMQIANHNKIQELKLHNQLEGKTMTDLLLIMAPEQQEISRTIDVGKVANGFYSRYKDNPIELKKIMEELQKLIDTSA